MLQPHETYLLLSPHRPRASETRGHTRASETRARRWGSRRRRLRELLRAPGSRLPLGLGVHHV